MYELVKISPNTKFVKGKQIHPGIPANYRSFAKMMDKRRNKEPDPETRPRIFYNHFIRHIFYARTRLYFS